MWEGRRGGDKMAVVEMSTRGSEIETTKVKTGGAGVGGWWVGGGGGRWIQNF